MSAAKVDPIVTGQLAIRGSVRDAAVTALRDAADQRARVARKASAQVLADDSDPRTASVRIVKLLGEASQLETLADTLETLETLTTTGETGMIPPTTPGQGAPALDPSATAAAVTVIVGGDGTSAEAQRLAALAGLESTELDEDPLDDDEPDLAEATGYTDVPARPTVPIEDPETNELPEDLLVVDGDGTPEAVVVDLDTPADEETP